MRWPSTSGIQTCWQAGREEGEMCVCVCAALHVLQTLRRAARSARMTRVDGAEQLSKSELCASAPIHVRPAPSLKRGLDRSCRQDARITVHHISFGKRHAAKTRPANARRCSSLSLPLRLINRLPLAHSAYDLLDPFDMGGMPIRDLLLMEAQSSAMVCIRGAHNGLMKSISTHTH